MGWFPSSLLRGASLPLGRGSESAFYRLFGIFGAAFFREIIRGWGFPP